MLDCFKESIANQFEASFCTLSKCIDARPDERWNEPVAQMKFCQVAFHALLFADVYLGPDLKSLREQSFHQNYEDVFADYEELDEREPTLLYKREFVVDYMQHCRAKAGVSIASETEETLSITPGFDWLKFSRAEVHVYNIRHIHHHAAQLSIFLRLNEGVEIPWIGTRWRD